MENDVDRYNSLIKEIGRKAKNKLYEDLMSSGFDFTTNTTVKNIDNGRISFCSGYPLLSKSSPYAQRVEDEKQ